MGKSITVWQDCPGAAKPYFLAPVGKYLNKALQGARKGDIIVFQNGWRYERRKLVRMCRMETGTPAFTFLVRSLYGEGTTIESIKGRWRDISVLGGFGKDGADMDVCLLGEIENIDD